LLLLGEGPNRLEALVSLLSHLALRLFQLYRGHHSIVRFRSLRALCGLGREGSDPPCQKRDQRVQRQEDATFKVVDRDRHVSGPLSALLAASKLQNEKQAKVWPGAEQDKFGVKRRPAGDEFEVLDRAGRPNRAPG
jgi:hypothetical protein